ncbi:sigma factor [Anatilimnocola sp. NA78]|uniref:sigma factor n=1 Tax=Anatilimnocola sp. NA78 TaxID=3415683 RepID=UPI003CE45508
MDPTNDLYSTTLAAIDSPETLCQIARPLIHSKARRLVGTAGFTTSDQDDIEQECSLRLIERFDAARGKANLPVLAFIKRIVNQSIANQLRDRFAPKRDIRRVHSLHRARTCNDSRDESLQQPTTADGVGALLEMAIDVDEVIDQLELDQQELCRLLKIESTSELARRFNRARSTVQDNVNRLRSEFEKRSVDQYLDQLRPTEPSIAERLG